MTDPALSLHTTTTVVVSGPAVGLLYRAALALAQRRHRDGLAASPLLQQTLTTLYRATVAQQRQENAPTSPPGTHCGGHDGDLLDSADAARLLGVSRRTVQRLTCAGKLLALRAGSARLYRRDAVMALAREREART